MPKFRTAVAGTTNAEFWSEGDAVGMARQGKGYFAMSKRGAMSKTVQTTMPAGSYCNIIDDCATMVDVGTDGMATININNADSMLAICVGCEDGDIGVGTTGAPAETETPGINTTPVVTTTTTVPSGPTNPPVQGMSRTVVFLREVSNPGQDVFIIGGISPAQRPGCSENAESSDCAIDISVNSLGDDPNLFGKYDAWREGDTKLDWWGPQIGQGTYPGDNGEVNIKVMEITYQSPNANPFVI